MTVIERWSAALKYLNSLSKDEVMEYFEAGLHRPLVFCAVRPEDGAACRRHAPCTDRSISEAPPCLHGRASDGQRSSSDNAAR